MRLVGTSDNALVRSSPYNLRQVPSSKVIAFLSPAGFLLERLCEIRYEDGREFHEAGLRITIDTLHRFEIFVGGILAAIGSGWAVLSAWLKPLH